MGTNGRQTSFKDLPKATCVGRTPLTLVCTTLCLRPASDFLTPFSPPALLLAWHSSAQHSTAKLSPCPRAPRTPVLGRSPPLRKYLGQLARIPAAPPSAAAAAAAAATGEVHEGGHKKNNRRHEPAGGGAVSPQLERTHSRQRYNSPAKKAGRQRLGASNFVPFSWTGSSSWATYLTNTHERQRRTKRPGLSKAQTERTHPLLLQ